MRRWRIPLAFLLGAFCAAFLLVYPLTVIQPFKYQDPQALQRALAVFRVAPVLAGVIALLSLAGLIWAWRRTQKAPRIVSGLLVLITCGTAVLTRINVFEKMFHPAGTPKFSVIAESKLDPKDMLITVVLKDEGHAYPIREMGYHHVVNDWIGGVPIVATY